MNRNKRNTRNSQEGEQLLSDAVIARYISNAQALADETGTEVQRDNTQAWAIEESEQSRLQREWLQRHQLPTKHALVQSESNPRSTHKRWLDILIFMAFMAIVVGVVITLHAYGAF